MSSSRRGRSLAEVMAPIEDDPAPGAPPAAPLRPEQTGHLSTPGHVEAEIPPAGSGGQVVVPVNVLVAPEDRRRLRQLSLDTNLSLQKLGHEAWNLLLHKRGLPPLKPVSANVPSGRSVSGVRGGDPTHS